MTRAGLLGIHIEVMTLLTFSQTCAQYTLAMQSMSMKPIPLPDEHADKDNTAIIQASLCDKKTPICVKKLEGILLSSLIVGKG